MKSIGDKKIKDILLGQDYLSVEDIKKAEKNAEFLNVEFVDSLISEGLITRELLGQAIAEYFDVFYANLNIFSPSKENVNKIPESVARKYNVVFFKEDENEIVVTTNNPKQGGLIAELEKVFYPVEEEIVDDKKKEKKKKEKKLEVESKDRYGTSTGEESLSTLDGKSGKRKKIVLAFSLAENIISSFVHYRKPLETRFAKIIESGEQVAPEILSDIYDDAFVFHASDIHFEPQEEQVLVRFRVDGVLHEAGHIPKEYYENILNRIKVRSQLRIDEHFATQDGTMRYGEEGKEADFRVSIVPTIRGEKVVMRILSQYVRGFALSDLGLSSDDQIIFEEAIKSPFGMILVTGPTGSGKTTTLYALLKLLNKPEVNITTIEEPVEYKMSGVNQIQVNPQTDLTFAKGLRSIVRQDPDIILVGEIRDEETAEIAVNAALTGHLLFSTFHANDAATSIPRLLDMGSEPFLLASTLNLIIAQRLVRKICNICRHSINVPQSKIKEVLHNAEEHFSEKTVTLYEGKKCESCGHTGFKGRTAIFEFIKVTPELHDLILESPSSQKIWELARAQGSTSLFEDGIRKVKSGVTTLEELLRVANVPYEDQKKQKTKNK